MAVHFAIQSRPKYNLDRRAAAVVFLLAAGTFGYWYQHFTGMSDAFAEESIAARGEIVAVRERTCQLTDYCIDGQNKVDMATVAFRDKAGQFRRAVAEFRALAPVVGDEVEIRYLESEPTSIIDGSSDVAQDTWTIIRIQLAIGLAICALFSIGFWLPKGMLTKY